MSHLGILIFEHFHWNDLIQYGFTLRLKLTLMSIPFIIPLFKELYSLIFYVKKRPSDASFLKFKALNYLQIKIIFS